MTHRALRAMAALLCAGVAIAAAGEATYAPVVPGRALEFPRDAGAHPGHRIEWWYVTGRVRERGAAPDAPGLGFQVTFFRVRNPQAESNPSRFAPRQVLFAHAALADPGLGRLLHDERAGRALEGLVEAATDDTRVRIDDWHLARRAGGAYGTRIVARDFTLELTLSPTQPVMLQGDAGFSRKGPSAAHASYYYSEPQLRVSGSVSAKGRAREVEGVAWLDHEWSSEPIAAEASGWDWMGVNLDDGGAVMAFRIRDKAGATLWSSGTLRDAGGATRALASEDVHFTPLRHWRSPRTGTRYPVAMEVKVGGRTWRIEPLMDDQELDARATTGTLYWEGAVSARSSDGAAGRGYLELTGYAERVPF